MAEKESSRSSPAPSAGEYVVIARRYRPQAFDELLGQEHVARALKQAIASDRVGHAYLFTGARGVGKTSAARILAKALNCVSGPTPTPCNQCEVCVSAATGDDMDVIEIDGASNNGVDEVRELRQNAAVRPSRARYKIYIIDEVHMLTKPAFNALLKTLEEPPEHVKFIFATTEAHKIPVTILSRCQRFDFAGIRASQIHARLLEIAAAEGVELQPEAGQILASRAAGSMRDSQSLLEQLLSAGAQKISVDDVTNLLGIAPAERLAELMRHLVAGNAAAAIADVDDAVSGGVEIGQLLDQLVGFFRDVMAAAAGCGADQLLYALPSQADEVAEIGRKLGIEKVLAIVQVLDQTAARMRVSTHGRTLVEMAIVRICTLESLDDLAAIAAELRAGFEPEHVKKNASPPPAVSGLGVIPDLPDAERKLTSTLDPDSSREQRGDSVNGADVLPPGSVLRKFQEALTSATPSPSAPAAPRISYRQLLAEQVAAAAERPFVKQALSLFEVPSGKIRYTPPDEESARTASAGSQEE